ncbi:MarR family winged helix-turn-helix transcriptional regulator [Kibdelosporangium aridum]|uniref:MarR family winged helix-turn-helix transcriptional regulator n=1 Tax=Kibdelosporangium aridum TaxID=2030 RepID=UPI000525011B
MATRSSRNSTNPDFGVLAGRLLFAVTSEFFAKLAAEGFDDLKPRHGTVLAYLDDAGVRATDLARLSGQHKQIIGTLIDELEELGYVQRRPDPDDRRAKLVCPTERGIAQMRAADQIMSAIHERHARRMSREKFIEFKATLADVTEYQRRRVTRLRQA